MQEARHDETLAARAGTLRPMPGQVPAGVLLAELVMSADRLIEAARVSDTPPVEGAWDAPTILGHVAEVDDLVWGARVDAMLAAHQVGSALPEFGLWEPDPVVTSQRCAGTVIEERAAEFMAARTRLLGRFRGLTDEQWQARARHEEFGELRLGDIPLLVLRHDEEHRASLVLPVSGSTGSSEVG